jgi:hypothetical protein
MPSPWAFATACERASPETDSIGFNGVGRESTVEALEQLREFVEPDAGPGVAHAYDGFLSLGTRTHGHARAARREFQRVVEEIHEYQTRRCVHDAGGRRRGLFERYVHVAVACRSFQSDHSFLWQLVQGHRFELTLFLTGIDSSEFQQLLKESRQALHFLQAGAQCLDVVGSCCGVGAGRLRVPSAVAKAVNATHAKRRR